MNRVRLVSWAAASAMAILLTVALIHAPFAAATPTTGNVVYLDQGWTGTQNEAFYHTPQGSLFSPASWLRALTSKDGTPFMAPTHMRELGFIGTDAPKTHANPYGWPIGLEVDEIGGVQTAGLTCAACHTAELTYHGTTMRVEGGGANIDVIGMLRDLRVDVAATGANPALRKEFLQRVVAYGYPKDRAAADFAAQYAVDSQTSGAAARDKADTPGGHGRVDALAGIAFNAFAKGLDTMSNAKRALAPVNFPPLWNIWHFDWVQYNASVRVPMDRNAGEALGLRAETNIVDPVTGKLNPEPLRWKSSINVKDLYLIENQLRALRPPVWPTAILGAIDPVKAARGRELFVANCTRCHGVQKIADTKPLEWYMRAIPLDRIGTDPTQAVVFAAARYDASKLGLGKSVTSAQGLIYVVDHIKAQAYRDAHIPASQWERYDGERTGDTVMPCAYKARPLVGIWATAPFLHNGAVPSVYDLLSQTRPSHPIIGNTEFDPKKLGVVQKQTPVTEVIDTTVTGDSNAGHWFTDDTARPGRIGPALSEEQKYDIIEYLKSATFANYPTTTISASSIKPAPCTGDPQWAAGKGPNLNY